MSQQRGLRHDKSERPQVEVVLCPSSFPISKRTLDSPAHVLTTTAASTKPVKQSNVLDWHATAKEVHALGAQAFIGKQKRNYRDEQYRLLTGREQKKQKVPLPIVRGIKRKAAQREARLLEEARASGIVLPKKPRLKKRKLDKTSQLHGPAPSIGFLHKGLLKVKERPK